MALRLLPLAFTGFILLGLPDGLLGVAWPSIGDRFDRSLGELGVILAALTVGYLLLGWTHGELTRRFGTGRLLVTSSAAATLGAFGYAFVPRWWILLVASVVWGGAGATIDAGINAHVALHHGTRALGFLHAGFGIGATFGPLLIAAILEAGRGWQGGYVILGTAQLLMTIGFWQTRDRWSSLGRPERPLRPAGIWLSLGLFFVYTGIEVGAGQWSFSLFTVSRGLDPSLAALLVAGFWASLTLGRFALGVAGGRVKEHRVVEIAGSVVVGGLLLLWWNPMDWLGAVGLLVAGVGLAPMFPLLVSMTPDRFGVAFAPSAIGYQLAAAAAGGALIPGGIGLAIELFGLESVGPILVLAALAMAGLGGVETVRRHRSVSSPPRTGS